MKVRQQSKLYRNKNTINTNIHAPFIYNSKTKNQNMRSPQQKKEYVKKHPIKQFQNKSNYSPISKKNYKSRYQRDLEALQREVAFQNELERKNPSILPHLQWKPSPIPTMLPSRRIRLSLTPRTLNWFQTWRPKTTNSPYRRRYAPFWLATIKIIYKRIWNQFFWLGLEPFFYDSFDFFLLTTPQFKYSICRRIYIPGRPIIFLFTFLRKIIFLLPAKKTHTFVKFKKTRRLLNKQRATLRITKKNSRRGILYYKLMLNYFRKKNIRFFLRYKSYIVPLLKKRFKIIQKKRRFTRKKRLRKLYGFRYAIKKFKRRNILKRKHLYKIFGLLKQGFRFLCGGLSKKKLFILYTNAKKNKNFQFMSFYFNLFRNLSMSLIFTKYLPRASYSYQFIRNKFVAVNGIVCTNPIYFLKEYDLIELNRYMFLLFFVTGPSAQFLRRYLYSRVRNNPFFVINYRLLLFMFAQNFEKGLVTPDSFKPNREFQRLSAFSFFFKYFERFFPN